MSRIGSKIGTASVLRSWKWICPVFSIETAVVFYMALETHQETAPVVLKIGTAWVLRTWA